MSVETPPGYGLLLHSTADQWVVRGLVASRAEAEQTAERMRANPHEDVDRYEVVSLVRLHDPAVIGRAAQMFHNSDCENPFRCPDHRPSSVDRARARNLLAVLAGDQWVGGEVR